MIVAGALLYVFLMWRMIVVCRRFSPWVLPVVLFLDICVMPWAFFPFGYLGWKLWFFWFAFRVDPVRGVFRVPRWPRTPLMRGPGRRRARRFPQPLPWTAGPLSGADS
jgi:hypothetical protein